MTAVGRLLDHGWPAQKQEGFHLERGRTCVSCMEVPPRRTSTESPSIFQELFFFLAFSRGLLVSCSEITWCIYSLATIVFSFVFPFPCPSAHESRFSQGPCIFLKSLSRETWAPTILLSKDLQVQKSLKIGMLRTHNEVAIFFCGALFEEIILNRVMTLEIKSHTTPRNFSSFGVTSYQRDPPRLVRHSLRMYVWEVYCRGGEQTCLVSVRFFVTL